MEVQHAMEVCNFPYETAVHILLCFNTRSSNLKDIRRGEMVLDTRCLAQNHSSFFTHLQEKSRLDWMSYKKDEGLEEELQQHNKDG